jgi:hypothetical protein
MPFFGLGTRARASKSIIECEDWCVLYAILKQAFHTFLPASVCTSQENSPNVEVDFGGFLAGPESHPVSLLPARHDGSVHCVAALDDPSNHRQELYITGGMEVYYVHSRDRTSQISMWVHQVFSTFSCVSAH